MQKRRISILLFLAITVGLLSMISLPIQAASLPSTGVSSANALATSEASGSRYAIFDDAATWEEAKRKCEERGGHLATISSAEENALVYDYMISQGVTSAYFGYSDAEEEGVWKWVTGETGSYENWHFGEPNSENANEDYAMFYWKFKGGTWNDGDFGHLTDGSGRNYICEWDDTDESECAGGHDWRTNEDDIDFICARCNKHQSVSPVLGYDFKNDAFSFSNAEVGSYDISFLGYRYMLPSLKYDICAIVANDVQHFLDYINRGSTYGGACFGIAAMNASFFAGMSTSDFGSDTAASLNIKDADLFKLNYDTKLKDAINIMYLSQSSMAVAGFQNFQDGQAFGDNNFEDLVKVAKGLKKGDYPPVVTFSAPFGGHAVNIIGIEPDDFLQDAYLVTTYDSNNPHFPSFLLVNKDFSEVRFRYYSEKTETWVEQYVYSISYFIESSLFNIDVLAPGLRSSAFYALKTAGVTTGDASVTDRGVRNTPAETNGENVISFLVPNENQVRITTPSGKIVTTENGSLTTEIASAYIIPFAGAALSTVCLPYEAGEYTVFCEDACYININHCQNAATLYAENGCSIAYSADGALTYGPADGTGYIEAAYYRKDILQGSDAMGLEAWGNVTDYLSITCDAGKIKLSGSDAGKQKLFVKHDNEKLSKEELTEEVDAGAEEITVIASNDEIQLFPEPTGFTPCDGSTNCPGKAFADMPVKGNWAHDSIDWAISEGITNGTSATTFGPEEGCTRAQVVTFLWRAAGQPAPASSTNPFTDVKKDAYYYNAVLWAVEKGITNGTSDTTFSPDETCTRAQIVTFLWRYEGQPVPASTNNPFADVKLSAYFGNAVLWAVESDITNGTSQTTFAPDDTCTRAQVVTFLYRDLMK